jgi:hypothetical protein
MSATVLAIILIVVGLFVGLIAWGTSRLRCIPGYRRKHVDPNYSGPERRANNRTAESGLPVFRQEDEVTTKDPS